MLGSESGSMQLKDLNRYCVGQCMVAWGIIRVCEIITRKRVVLKRFSPRCCSTSNTLWSNSGNTARLSPNITIEIDRMYLITLDSVPSPNTH